MCGVFKPYRWAMENLLTCSGIILLIMIVTIWWITIGCMSATAPGLFLEDLSLYLPAKYHSSPWSSTLWIIQWYMSNKRELLQAY